MSFITPLGLEKPPKVPPLDSSAPVDSILAYVDLMEPKYEELFQMIAGSSAAVEGITRSKEICKGVNGNDIEIFIHRPDHVEETKLPCIIHLHGGGMSMLSAAGLGFSNIRDDLADKGCLVIGVEFRNAGGALGPHPFPAGLNDCSSALRYVHDHKDRLGISTVTLVGESGGANLSLATTLKAKRDKMLHMIDGVYGMCPYIAGPVHWFSASPDKYASMIENDGYFINVLSLGLMGKLYDPTGEHSRNPLAFPLSASKEDLESLPPHCISVNELDPLRDEGLAYHRQLLAAGNSSVCKTIMGTFHSADINFKTAIPDIYASTIRDIVGFAKAQPCK